MSYTKKYSKVVILLGVFVTIFMLGIPVGAQATTSSDSWSLSATSSNTEVQIDLSWNSFANTNANTAGYFVYSGLDGQHFNKIATLSGANNISYQAGKLAAATTYYYYVAAYDSSYRILGESGVVNAKTISIGPKVVSVNPPNGEVNIGTDQATTGNSVTIVFDQAVSFPNSAITVTTPGSANLVTSIAYNSSTLTATVTVGNGQYAPNTTYTVTVSTEVHSTSTSLPLKKSYSWSFQTGSTAQRFPHGDYTAATSQCSLCHNSHKATGEKLTVNPVTSGLCDMCHNGVQAPDNGYPGTTNYNTYGHGKSTTDTISYLGCQYCHDPHTTQYPDYPSSQTPMTYATADTVAVTYDSTNFTLCTQCHSEFTNYTQPMTTANTMFYNDVDPQATTQDDLHYLHLQQAAIDNGGSQGVTCYDCHNPHGSANDNQGKVHEVGFPQTVALLTTNNTTGYTTTTNGGGCNLTCHGVTHLIDATTTGDTVDSRYINK